MEIIAGTKIEIITESNRLLHETGKPITLDAYDDSGTIVSDDGRIRTIEIKNGGVGYTSVPRAYPGGYLYFDSVSGFQIDETITGTVSGATASVSGTDSSVDLTGTYTKPAVGTYTHGYAMMNNTFGITASIKIDGSMDGVSSGSGVFCGTLAASGNHTKASGSHSNNSVCSSTAVTGGKFTETLTHFGGSGDDWTRIATADNINGTTASVKGILVDSNGHLASEEGEVDKLEGLVTFADSITVTADTTSLTMSFNLGEGMSLNSGGADKIHMGSGPFQAIMTAN